MNGRRLKGESRALLSQFEAHRKTLAARRKMDAVQSAVDEALECATQGSAGESSCTNIELSEGMYCQWTEVAGVETCMSPAQVTSLEDPAVQEGIACTERISEMATGEYVRMSDAEKEAKCDTNDGSLDEYTCVFVQNANTGGYPSCMSEASAQYMLDEDGAVSNMVQTALECSSITTKGECNTDESLSVGAIVGIAVGAAAVVALIITMTVCYFKKAKARKVRFQGGGAEPVSATAEVA